MHELYAYAGTRIYLTMWLPTKANTEINYEANMKLITIKQEIMLQVKTTINLSILWAKLLYIFKREN